MAHKFVNQIEPGETIDDIYVIRDPILRSTTRGDLYIAMFLSDRSGQLNGRMWQATETIYRTLPKPGFAHVQGRSELYQNNLQVIVNNISLVDASQVHIEDFLAKTDKDTHQMFEEVRKIVGQIKNSQLKALVGEFLADADLMEKFCNVSLLRSCRCTNKYRLIWFWQGSFFTTSARPKNLRTIWSFHTPIQASSSGMWPRAF